MKDFCIQCTTFLNCFSCSLLQSKSADVSSKTPAEVVSHAFPSEPGNEGPEKKAWNKLYHIPPAVAYPCAPPYFPEDVSCREGTPKEGLLE